MLLSWIHKYTRVFSKALQSFRSLSRYKKLLITACISTIIFVVVILAAYYLILLAWLKKHISIFSKTLRSFRRLSKYKQPLITTSISAIIFVVVILAAYYLILLSWFNERPRIISKALQSFRGLSRYRKLLITASTSAIIFVVVILAAYYLKWFPGLNTAEYTGQAQLSKSRALEPETVVSGIPIQIDIPSININIPVIKGYYYPSSNTWTLSLSAAQFMTTSTPANNKEGLTYIYGHYRRAVFAYLHLIQPGETASLTTDNGYAFNYKFIKTYAVSPSDLSVLNYKGAPILIVQTCSGSFFQNRQMYVFEYLGYSKLNDESNNS